MSYSRVRIPVESRDAIYSWGLSRQQVLAVLTALHLDLLARLDSLWRLAAPMPTWVFRMDLPVEGSPLRVHLMTFYVVEGEDEGTLVVAQCDHVVEDDLGDYEEPG